MLNKLKNLLIETIFPSYCLGCRRIGSFVCGDCFEKIIKIKSQTCPFCKKISPGGATCPNCKSKASLEGVLSFGYFKDDLMREIVYRYKYEGLFAISEIISDWLLNLVNQQSIDFDLITFTPLSRKRKNKRGYNQSEVLAKKISKKLKIPCEPLIEKRRETKPQVGLGRKERILNLKNAFFIKKRVNLTSKRIVIVDDVITTGSTLNECAFVLKNAGAKKVWGLTIAKE
ncbi:MAG: ComF family protein [Patescibacteria group bacterium]|nr:ComF family protein [Patescibacteria group bacterium]